MYTRLAANPKGPYTLTSFLIPVAGASQLAPVNWRVYHATGTRISLVPVTAVPVGFNIAHVLFVCRQLAPETGTGYWYQKTGQCVWPFSTDTYSGGEMENISQSLRQIHSGHHKPNSIRKFIEDVTKKYFGLLFIGTRSTSH